MYHLFTYLLAHAFLHIQMRQQNWNGKPPHAMQTTHAKDLLLPAAKQLISKIEVLLHNFAGKVYT